MKWLGKYLGFVLVILAVGWVIFGVFQVEDNGSSKTNIIMDKLNNTRYQKAPEIANPHAFINTEPFELKDLVGRQVILIDFWTFSCINCQRTLPYLREWHKKYSEKGLTIVGMHTPEFEFEKNIKNVQRAVDEYHLEHPVVLDNEYGTWKAYGNRYWPRKYLIDINGNIVYDHIGEGGYDETEQKIKELLAERASVVGGGYVEDTSIVAPKDTEVVEVGRRLTPELYFGSLRNNYLGNGEPGTSGTLEFTTPKGIKANILYLDGKWNIQPEYAEAVGRAKVILRYQAGKVFLVASGDGNIKMIRNNSAVETNITGSSVDKGGLVKVSEDHLYRLIEDPAGYGEHTLELEVDPGVKLFAFTFG